MLEGVKWQFGLPINDERKKMWSLHLVATCECDLDVRSTPVRAGSQTACLLSKPVTQPQGDTQRRKYAKPPDD